MSFITEPKVEDRKEQPYMGIRTPATMQNLDRVIPQCLDEVFGLLGKHGVGPDYAPFIRYYVINMECQMDVEVGIPVASALPGEGQIQAGVLPAGRYASLVYTGIDNGIRANAALLDWGAQKGLVWD